MLLDSGVRKGRGQRIRHEEAVPQERAFEDEMDQRVEGVPDEQDADFQRAGFGQDFEGRGVCGCEESEDAEQRDHGRGVDGWACARRRGRRDGGRRDGLGSEERGHCVGMADTCLSVSTATEAPLEPKRSIVRMKANAD